jgi:hypothetical protein
MSNKKIVVCKKQALLSLLSLMSLNPSAQTGNFKLETSNYDKKLFHQRMAQPFEEQAECNH